MNSKLRLTTALNIGSTFSFELETEYITENMGKDSRQASTPINSLMSESVFLSAFSNNEALEKSPLISSVSVIKDKEKSAVNPVSSRNLLVQERNSGMLKNISQNESYGENSSSLK